MKRLRQRLLVITFCAFQTFSVHAKMDLKNIHCACVGAKTPSQKDYIVIKILFPQADQVLRLVFKEKTFYILVRNRKIDRILSGWETGVENQHIWLVLDQNGRLLEVVRYPSLERLDFRKQKIFLESDIPSGGEDYFTALQLLHDDLALVWTNFIRRIHLNIFKVDATTQATP